MTKISATQQPNPRSVFANMEKKKRPRPARFPWFHSKQAGSSRKLTKYSFVNSGKEQYRK